MDKFDCVIYDLVKIYEKYDLFWRPGNELCGHHLDEIEDPWNQYSGNNKYTNTSSARINNQFALIELLSNHVDIFKDYVCPYERLKKLIKDKKGLSPDAKYELDKLVKRCIDAEHERKLWIHTWLKNNCSSNFKKNVKALVDYKNNQDLTLSFKGNFEILSKNIKKEYYKKFPTIPIPLPNKKLIDFAQGNKKYFIWDGNEYSQYGNFCNDNFWNLHFIYLFEAPESTMYYIQKKTKNIEKETQAEMKSLYKQSLSISKVGFFKRFLNFFT